MPNREQWEILEQGVPVWNEWREENPEVAIDLSSAILIGAKLDGADFRDVDFRKAYLRGSTFANCSLQRANLWKADLVDTYFRKANLWGANLSEAHLDRADFVMADLTEADLRNTCLYGVNLSGADISRVDLRGSHLVGASFMQTEVHDARVSGSWIYGINVWGLIGDFAEQKDLVITGEGEPEIAVDNFEVAQFVYLILNNKKLRDVINTFTTKVVLILGRFTKERKMVLLALKNELRQLGFLPILFDFERSNDRDFTETIKTLSGLSFFVIADITNPSSSPLELQATVPDYHIPFVPIIQEGERPFAMMADLQKTYPWVLETVSYNSIETLLKALKPAIIDRAKQKHEELRLLKARYPKILSVSDFIDNKD